MDIIFQGDSSEERSDEPVSHPTLNPMPKKRFPPRETRIVGKELTQREAFKKASGKKFVLKHDHRGAKYNPNTGKITYT